ncbi:MAG: Leucyl aminopeptidase [Candidatus Heimdallarchaeota archaeon LC_3]|nr:MAG: Leucyl aminopeptidase [Candidatus Heimdallarchaeota archaeon LC_3]
MIIFITIGIGNQSSQAISDSLEENFNIQVNTPVPIPTKDELHHYNISVYYEPSTHSTTGWTNISFLNKEAIILSNLMLHLWGNDVESDSIIIHNIYNETNSLLNYVISSSNKLNITTEPILQNQRYIIYINFTVNLPNIPSRFGYSDETYLTQAFGNWYPILALREDGGWNLNPYANGGESFYSEMSYIDIKITSDNSEVIVGAGDLQEVTINGNEYTYYYTAGPVRDFTWMASPDYLVYSELYNGVNISSYYYPEHSERGISVVDVSKKSLDLFSEIFEPYPYNSMSVGEIDAWFGGMEYNQLVMINDIYYNESERGYDRFEDVISHEWAHTWNTYLTGNNPYLDPWLDESWAMYASSLYFEEYYNNDYYIGRLQFIKQDYLDFASGSNTDKPLSSGMDYWDFNQGTYEVVYAKGMVVIDMLRYVMGDIAFFEAIIDYYDSFSYTTASTDDFIEIFSNHTEEDITWFFDQFLYDTIILDYEITSATMYKNDSSNNWDITLGILNYHNSDSPPIMKVPISIQSNNNFYFDVIIDETFNEIHVSVPQSLGKPTFAYLDSDWQVLRKQRTIQLVITETDTPGVITSSSLSTSITSSIETPTTPTTSLTIIFILFGIGVLVLRRRKGNLQ